jgi:hypothetical protein
VRRSGPLTNYPTSGWTFIEAVFLFVPKHQHLVQNVDLEACLKFPLLGAKRPLPISPGAEGRLVKVKR